MKYCALRLRSSFMYSLAYLALYIGPLEDAQSRAWWIASTIGPLLPSKTNRLTQGRHLTSILMNSILCWFAVIKPGFPIKTRLSIDSAATLADRNGAGLLIVTVHTRLGLAMNAALRAQGVEPVFVGKITAVDMRKNSWGSEAIPETIDSQILGLFFRIDAALRAGRVVVLFTDFDTMPGQDRIIVSPNAFNWIRLVGHRLAYGLALAGQDGDINIAFSHAEEDEPVAGFVRFLEALMPVCVEVCRPKSRASVRDV